MNEKLELSEVSQSAALPPRARMISELSPMSSLVEASSSNQVSLMVNNKRDHKVGTPKKYFFKQYPLTSCSTELESYCASISRLLAPKYVPNTHPYYDEESSNPVGVASKTIEGFRSNYENPLDPSDFLINDPVIHAEFTQRNAVFITQNLLEHYNQQLTMMRRIERFLNIGDSLETRGDNLPGEQAIRNSLLEYINNAERCSADTILEVLCTRRAFLTNSLVNNSPRLAKEQRLLDQVIRELGVLNTIRPNAPGLKLTIELLEQFHRKVIAEGINLDDYSDTIVIEIDDIAYEVGVLDLKNYCTLRGLATCLTTRYIFEEGDANNTNFSKKGEFIDFGWTKAGLLFQSGNHKFWDRQTRHPEEISFACTEHNLRHFPDLKGSNLFYWPTLQPDFMNLFLRRMNGLLSECERKLLESENMLLSQVIACIFALFENNHSQNIAFAELLKESAHGLFLTFTAYMTSQSPRDLMVKEKIRNLFSMLRDYVNRFALDLKSESLNTANIAAALNHLYAYIDHFSLTYPVLIEQLKAPGLLLAMMGKLGFNVADLKNIESMWVLNKEFFDQLSSGLVDLKSDIQQKFEQYQHNVFTPNDNIHFKLLAGHPVFIVHKYKTLLKYILTDAAVYRTYAALNIPAQACSSSEEGNGSIHDLLVNDEVKRIQEIRQALIAMPDFRLFIRQYGNFAFALIQDEFKELREKYSHKGIQRVYYEPLINALDPELMIAKFLKLCSECKGVEEGLSTQVEDTPLSACWV